MDYLAKATECAAALNPQALVEAQRKSRAGEPMSRKDIRQLSIEADRLQYIALARNA